MPRPHFFMFSSMHRTQFELCPVITRYIVTTVLKADEGSEFEEKTRQIRHLPQDVMLDVLLKHGYECALAINHDQVLAHVAFQKHPTEWHVFSVRARPEGAGHGSRIACFFMSEAYDAGVGRVCLWAEDRKQQLSQQNATRMRKIFGRITTNMAGLPFEVSALPGGYIELLRPAPVIALNRASDAGHEPVAA